MTPNDVREGWDQDTPELVWTDTAWIEALGPSERRHRLMTAVFDGGDEDEVIVAIVIQEVPLG